jgi:hypothetical protein
VGLPNNGNLWPSEWGTRCKIVLFSLMIIVLETIISNYWGKKLTRSIQVLGVSEVAHEKMHKDTSTTGHGRAMES